MNANPSLFPLDMNHLEVAARSAIRTWDGEEGALSREMRATDTVSEAFLSRWLGRWMLARSNPTRLRAALAGQLETVVRPALIAATDAELAGLVPVLASGLLEAGATTGLQTSLVSKFAFSLRPEVIVPYDKRARLGLGEMFGRRLPDHDYPAYLAAFHRFASAFSAHLDETGVAAAMRTDWEPVMSERLFRMRAADKYFMLLGGFPVERMARN
jgi:hypothetical protein